MRVHSPLMEVEDKDSANHTAGHHHHDTGEVGAYKWGVAAWRLHSRNHVHEECEGHEDCDAEGELLSRVRGCLEAKNHHAGNEYTRSNEVVEVVDGAPPNVDLKSHIYVVVSHVWNTVSYSVGTDKMPLCILTESGRVCFPTVHSSPVAIIHGQVHQALMVGPSAKLEVAYLLIKGKPGHVHLAGRLEYAWRNLFNSAITVYYQ